MRRRTFVGLTLGLLGVWGLVASAPPPMPRGFLSAYHWQNDSVLFGGFSAIETDPDGMGFVAITDKSLYTTAHIFRDTAGLISWVEAAPLRQLHDKTGQPFGEFASDAEGLAIATNGAVYVSFERVARVARYDTLNGPSHPLPKHPAFKTMLTNQSLEALAIGANGTLYTLPENPDGPAQVFPIYRFQNGVWDQPFGLPKRGYFLAVAADIGPDGRFYLLERQFFGFSGFASRVRRFVVNSDGLTHEETLLQSVPGQHDNLEGLSVWRDAAGSLRLTMISDNNLLFVQRTEIVEYRVPD